MSESDDEHSDVFRGVLPRPPKAQDEAYEAPRRRFSASMASLHKSQPIQLPLLLPEEEAAQMAALGLPTSLRNHTADVNGDRYYTVACCPAKRAKCLELEDAQTIGESDTTRAKHRTGSSGTVDNPSRADGLSRAEETALTNGARRRSIRLMNDYGCVLPLWGELDGVREQLSRRLEKELRSLAHRFNTHFDRESGWDSDQRAARHREHALHVHRRLQAALPDYDVELNLWEVSTE